MNLLPVQGIDLETQLEFVELNFSNDKSASAALRAFKTAHGRHLDTFCVSVISRLIRRFRETGSVADKPRSGRPGLEDEREATVAEELQAQQSNPELRPAGCRSTSRRTNVP